MSLTPFDRSVRFNGKRLHLGVSGSVASYKSCDLVRTWKKLGIHVSVTLSDSACRFVSPLLFESLGALPVYGSMFADNEDCFAHLTPGQTAQAMILAPASADTLARLAQGRASDMLSAQALAFDGPLVLAPAMNPRMWGNPATRANVARLREYGAIFVGPDSGGTACGDEGVGRLAPLSEIFLAALKAISPQDMGNFKVMVTLGPTREPWDKVRFWSNPSSGRMGACLAVAAWLRGARVTAVCGPVAPLCLPAEIDRIDVSSANDMYEAARDCWPSMDMGMFCAAVADFSPIPPENGGTEHKFKKSDAPQGLRISFRTNPDILLALSTEKRHDQKILAFAAETAPDMESLLPLAQAKLYRKKADILAANRINSDDSGFAANSNRMLVVDKTGRNEQWPLQDKADAAWDLCSWLLRI